MAYDTTRVPNDNPRYITIVEHTQSERDEMDNAAREMVEYDNELETLCTRVLVPTWYHDYDEPHAECAVHVIDTLAHTLSRDDVSPMSIRTALVLALGTIDHLLNANDGL